VTTHTPRVRLVRNSRVLRRADEIIDAAARMFAERGYHGTTTQAIADVLGMRQASLYYYFPSKEAALAAICEHGVKDFISNLQAIIAEPISASDKLKAAIANHLAPLRRHPDADYVCVFIRHRRELPNGPRQAIAALAHTYQESIERLFADGIAARQFRADLDPKLATLALLGLCNSVITARGVPRSSTIDAMIEEYARIVIGGGVAGERAIKPKRRKR
jgi:TetR/AcrR family transcriptional regulator, cholesterol catabolism regulator